MIKKSSHVIDPPRFPKLINPIENSMKEGFSLTVKSLTVDVTKKLVEEVKKK